MDRPDFRTMEQVEKADREQLACWYCTGRAMRAAIIQREPAKLVRDALLSFHAAKLVLSVTGMSWLAMIGLGLTTILLVRTNLERA